MSWSSCPISSICSIGIVSYSIRSKDPIAYSALAFKSSSSANLAASSLLYFSSFTRRAATLGVCYRSFNTAIYLDKSPFACLLLSFLLSASTLSKRSSHLLIACFLALARSLKLGITSSMIFAKSLLIRFASFLASSYFCLIFSQSFWSASFDLSIFCSYAGVRSFLLSS